MDKINSLQPGETIFYHNICKRNYFKQCKYKYEKNQTNWHVCRDLHDIDFIKQIVLR